MHVPFHKSPITLAAMAGALAVGLAPTVASAQAKPAGTYLAGDFHNHSTCSDGAVSMQKKVKRSMDRTAETPWGLDWFVQAGHGGSGNRNCTLPEDATFATPAYPVVTNAAGTVLGPQTRWQSSQPPVQPKGAVSGTPPNQNMWRWQAIQEIQYPVMEYLARYRDEPLFLGLESVVAGHEHTSMAVISGQMPASMYGTPLPTTPGYTALGNADALAQWSYCFDRGNSDTSRGNSTLTSGIGNNWDCSVPGSANATAADWNAAAFKLNGANGNNGHLKTVEAVKWMAAFHPDGSYYVPAHLERAGPFNPAGNNGFNVEHLRNFNNAGPRVAFGFESQPGHGAADQRGEYNIRRNTISGVNVDSAGGTTFGGTGVYAAQVGGVWDALLGEGRNWWFFASSDWHSRGAFSVDDRRSDNDFWPGEYQRNYTMVRHGGQKVTPQTIVDGLRTGNTWVASGQLIDRLAFVSCATYPNTKGSKPMTAPEVEALALQAARSNTDIDRSDCATMGQKLVVRPGAHVITAVALRDPAGKSYSPYSFANPSLAQIGVTQPMDAPVLDHVDVIAGLVSGYRNPTAADYAGAWPDNWVDLANPQQLRSLASVPAAAKNESAKVVRVFDKTSWKTEGEYRVMSFRIPQVEKSQYVRLRGSNLPAAVPFETDATGNPLSDNWTNDAPVRFKNSGAVEFARSSQLRIPCKAVGANVPDNGVVYTGAGIDGCPNHLPVVNGQKMVAFDVAAWADLWFYSNPIFVEVAGSTVVAGVK
jgi:hypothetical protein